MHPDLIREVYRLLGYAHLRRCASHSAKYGLGFLAQIFSHSVNLLAAGLHSLKRRTCLPFQLREISTTPDPKRDYRTKDIIQGIVMAPYLIDQRLSFEMDFGAPLDRIPEFA